MNKQLLANTMIFWLFALGFQGCAQPNQEPIRLIVRADDIGFSHTSNLACIEAATEGIATTVEIMVPGPWFPEAARMLREHPEIDAGIHLVMTSEWDNLKWRPLTGPSSFTDAFGYFHPMVWPNDRYPAEQTFKESGYTLEDVEKELRAQFSLAKQEVPHLSHFTTHMGFTSADEALPKIVEKLAKEFGVYVQVDGHPTVQRFRPFEGMDKSALSSEEKIQAFIKGLENLGPGNWLFVTHPSYDWEEMRAIRHEGNSDVAKQRQHDTDFLTDPRVKEAVAKKGILLTSYKDFKELME